ncbi:MAG: hypothetical protein RLZZ326_743, partial [Planctomycetota bacterium]
VHKQKEAAVGGVATEAATEIPEEPRNQ